MQAPRHPEVAEYGPRDPVPYGRAPEGGGHEELHRLLREATRLIESADLRGASETLGEVGELAASMRDPPGPAVPMARSEHTKVNDTRQRR